MDIEGPDLVPPGLIRVRERRPLPYAADAAPAAVAPRTPGRSRPHVAPDRRLGDEGHQGEADEQAVHVEWALQVVKDKSLNRGLGAELVELLLRAPGEEIKSY